MNDKRGECRHYLSYSGVKLPLKLISELEEANLANRNTYFRAYLDEQQRIVVCQKVVYGEIEFEHRYEYYADGALKRAEITEGDEEPKIMCFDNSTPPPNF